MRRRPAFTLIEMMVAMTLTIFIMIIISQAFITALETFRQLKALGDMQAALRNTVTILRRDLSADHFEAKRRLSDSNFWTVGPPQQGFFRLRQNALPTDAPEGKDADNITARRRTGHVLHFTSKSRGNDRATFYNAQVGDAASPLLTQDFGRADSRFQEPVTTVVAAGTPKTYKTYNAQWAEIAYFLTATGATANGTPLFSLYRRQRLAVPDNFDMNWTAPAAGQIHYVQVVAVNQQLADYSQISCMINPDPRAIPPRLYFNNPTDLTVPDRRLQAYTPVTDANGNATGDDLLLGNVVSFDVQASGVPGVFVDPAGGLFDTWSRVTDDVFDYSDATVRPVPNAGIIRALQITIRVWDIKTEQSRQITIFQDM